MKEIKNYNQALLEIDFVINAPYTELECFDKAQKEKLYEDDMVLPVRQTRKANIVPDYAYAEMRKYTIAQKRNQKITHRQTAYAKKIAKQNAIITV